MKRLLLFDLLLLHVAHACYTIDVATELLSGTYGASFTGAPTNVGLRYCGHTVSAAGDVNGDGYDDFLLSQTSYATGGVLYLVWGRSDWKNNLAGSITFSAAASNPTNYVVIYPPGGCMGSGYDSLSSGDINGDGYSDIIASGVNDHACGFVVFGHSGTWSSPITAGAVGGVVIRNFESISSTDGEQPSNVGDVNGDGVIDLFVGMWGTYGCVVMGSAQWSVFQQLTISCEQLENPHGFVFSDIPTADFGYGHFGPAGDINGDGLDDILVGAREDSTSAATSGRAYVVFGRNVSVSGSWPSVVNLTAALDGNSGFVINGPAISGASMGWLAFGAGDINGDGIADVFLNSNANEAYVIFGHRGPWSSALNVDALDGSTGFAFKGGNDTSFFGYSGGPAGDVNGDGIDDLVVSHVAIGAVYVLYGHRGSWPASLGPNNISAAAGFKITASDVSGFGTSAQGAGDVNGDGLADIIVGAPQQSNEVGQAFLVLGKRMSNCAVCNLASDICQSCADDFAFNGSWCIAVQDVVVIIDFNGNVTGNENSLAQEIADALGIDVGLVSVVVVTPTQVQVTIAGETLSAAEATASQLVNIIINGGSAGSTTQQLLRKAIDAHIRKDDDDDNKQSSNDDGNINAAALLSSNRFIASIIVVFIFAFN